jgi:hypothetical protein
MQRKNSSYQDRKVRIKVFQNNLGILRNSIVEKLLQTYYNAKDFIA